MRFSRVPPLFTYVWAIVLVLDIATIAFAHSSLAVWFHCSQAEHYGVPYAWKIDKTLAIVLKSNANLVTELIHSSFMQNRLFINNYLPVIRVGSKWILKFVACLAVSLVRMASIYGGIIKAADFYGIRPILLFLRTLCDRCKNRSRTYTCTF